jgi:hypothetical protein
MPYRYNTPSQKDRFIGACLLIGCLMIGSTMSLVGALIWSKGELTAESIGYVWGSLLLPGLFSFFIAVGSRRQKPLKFSVSFVLGCALVLATNYAISN